MAKRRGLWRAGWAWGSFLFTPMLISILLLLAGRFTSIAGEPKAVTGVKSTPTDPVPAVLEHGRSPDCKGRDFSAGPPSGLCTSVTCRKCGSRFNVSGVTGNMMVAERTDLRQ